MLVSPVVVVDVVVVVLVQPIVPNVLIPAHWPAVYDAVIMGYGNFSGLYRRHCFCLEKE